MDFSTLLQVAKKNNANPQNESSYYKTKFAPPKKETKKEKELSENIQRFLKKREEEERRKQQEEKLKLNNLLAKRDEKAKNKIRKMLKVTKSANKSVLDDAVNTEHTAVTMEGPEQPDQDDYGYVSMEANAFYQKYIEKVKDVKEDKGFAPSRPLSIKDLSGTKERVKAAITREVEEKGKGSRQRNSSSTAISAGQTTLNKDASINVARAYSTSKNLYDAEAERAEEERKKREEQQRKMKNRKPAPPPMDFQALLKLAEQKQHEPIEIAPVSVKAKEPERLLTLKEKRELEERQRAKEQRARREREPTTAPSIAKEQASKSTDNRNGQTTARMEPNGRIPKLNQAVKPAASSSQKSLSTAVPNSSSKHKSISTVASSSSSQKPLPSKSSTVSTHYSNKSDVKKSQPITTAVSKNNEKINGKTAVAAHKTNFNGSGSKISAAATSSAAVKSNSGSKNPYGNNNKTAYSGPTRQFPPADVQQKTRQFPPADVRKSINAKKPSLSSSSSAHKRRIEDDYDDDNDDDYDEDYDSEMDDFIDDGDAGEDISAHIRNIFGYDRNRYKNMDDDDDAAMESNFAQVQREEFISKKIGLKEDLEDMKMEALHKKRKMEMKKRRLH